MCNLDGRTNWCNGWQRGTRRTSPITEHGKTADQFPYAAANQYNDSTAYQYHNRAANWFDDTRCGSRIKFTYNHSDSAANQHSTLGIGEHSPHAGDDPVHNCSGDGFNCWQRFAKQPEFAFNVILKSGKRSSKYRGDIALGSALPANGWQQHISEVEVEHIFAARTRCESGPFLRAKHRWQLHLDFVLLCVHSPDGKLSSTLGRIPRQTY